MARRVVSRKDLRAQAEAAEAQEQAEPKKKAVKKKTTVKRKTKTKAAADVRMKLYWGVFSQNLKRVAVFEFDQKDEADKRAEELSKGGKSPHFVQKVKEEVVAE
ncbi:hypothetical protein [Candidatus Laterigemmans baculatus]|uniref:hypothetical protein n=1 Tax=Candidatus Laterigemmans baculatus TaxID=2770505 RepID=UPI0013DD095E|nr:hypothetical protein [Candidatus Laterigemmans baculatus]